MSTDIYLYAVKHKQGNAALLGEFPSLPTDHPSDSVSIRKTIGQWNSAPLGEYLEEYLDRNGGSHPYLKDDLEWIGEAKKRIVEGYTVICYCNW